MKAVVAIFNQEKALVGAFSVITNLRMDLFEALVVTSYSSISEHVLAWPGLIYWPLVSYNNTLIKTIHHRSLWTRSVKPPDNLPVGKFAQEPKARKFLGAFSVLNPAPRTILTLLGGHL